MAPVFLRRICCPIHFGAPARQILPYAFAAASRHGKMDALLTDMETQRKCKEIQSTGFWYPSSSKKFKDFGILPRLPYLPHEFLTYGHARTMCEVAERVARKKMTKRQLTKKLKQLRWVTKIKKANMDAEQKILHKIEKAKKHIELLEEKMNKFVLPSQPMPEHDPEPLTPEELHYLKKMAQKSKNYVPIGRRGVFGGVVQNMHLHWKKHQTVNIWCQHYSKEEVLQIADELARLSGGIVVGFKDGDTIVMYRGRNYMRPKDIIPKNTLSKRKALFRSLCLQSLKSHRLNLQRAEEELEQYRGRMTQEAENMPSSTNENLEPAVADEPGCYFSESDSVSDVDVDPALMLDSDSEYDFEYESSSRIGSTNEDFNLVSASDSNSDSLVD